MNRRSFFKVVTGFVVGIFAGSAKPEYSCSASMSGHPSAENSVEPESMTMGTSSSYIYTCDAIQEAIDLAKDFRRGGIVYFPKGTYNNLK